MLRTILGNLALASFGLAVMSPAGAHYVWLERDSSQHPALYFGEYQEQLKEASGGRLDKIKDPRAWRLDEDGTRRALEVTRKADRFDLGMVDAGAAVIAEERNYEVMDLRQYGYGIAKPVFYARLQPLPVNREGKPQLDLDILPRPGAANAFVVYFRNEPLPRTKVVVYAPNFWQQEHRTDDQGRLKITTPWPGHYVLEALHTEKQPGEFKAQPFESIRHRATLSFSVKAGANER